MDIRESLVPLPSRPFLLARNAHWVDRLVRSVSIPIAGPPVTATPRERLIQDIGDCFKGECAKVARGEKSTQADGERGVFSDASLADYLLSHGWRESGQAGELDTSTAAASDATVASAQPSVVSASPAPSLEAREPLSDAEVDRIGFKVEPEFRKLFDAFERCNGLEPERENLIRAVASALRGEG